MSDHALKYGIYTCTVCIRMIHLSLILLPGCTDPNDVPVCRDNGQNGTAYCISRNRLCDGVRDCKSGEDESDFYCRGRRLDYCECHTCIA